MKFPSMHMSGRTALLRGGVVFLLAVVATLLYLWQHMVMVDLGYRIETARAEMSRVSHQRDELLLEVARLSSLNRIERIASTRLSMRAPEPDQLVRVIIPTGAERPEQKTPDGDRPVMLAANSGP